MIRPGNILIQIPFVDPIKEKKMTVALKWILENKKETNLI